MSLSHRLLIASLVLANAWGLIGGSVGLNALIKSNRDKARLRKLAVHPPVTRLVINTNDTLHSGIIVAVTCALVGLVAGISLKMLLLPSWRRREAPTRRLRGFILALCVLWLTPAQIAFTFFYATRSAIVKAFIGMVEVPQAVVKAQQATLHVSPVYKILYYLKLLAILPWFAILFGTIASIALITIPPDEHSGDQYPSTPDMSEKVPGPENGVHDKI